MVRALIFIFEIAILVLLGFICSEVYLLKKNAAEVTELHITASAPASESPQAEPGEQPAAPVQSADTEIPQEEA